jgi:serine/threonine-protein kinase HipA
MAIIKVTIWGNTVGAVAWDNRRNHSVFEFSEAFVKLGLDLSPVTMPLKDLERGQRIYSFPELNQQSFEGLPGLLSDSLPDAFGNAVIRGWLRSQNRKIESFTPLEKLSYVGTRAMGALEFEPTIKTPEPSEEIEMERLLRLTNKVLNEKQNISLDLNANEERAMANLIKIGSSAGGQRPKAIIGFNHETKEVKSGQISLPKGFGYYLMKFDGIKEGSLGDPAGFGRVELAYYLMARDSGIIMQPCSLFEENGRAHFLTLRFDRKKDGTKLHIQTLCALSHFDFNLAGAFSYEDAFEEMRALNLPYPDMEQLYRRMVFNVVARNQDDHTKNISFLMDQTGNWQLAPAYDMTWSFNPMGDWTNMHQMSINQKRDEFSRSDLTEIANKQGIKNAGRIIDKIVDSVGGWKKFAQQTEVDKVLTEQIKKTHRLYLGK